MAVDAVAIVAGGLTLTLQKNQARIRYGLWLAASIKFLIPFSWLIALGNQLAWLCGSAETSAGVYIAMEEVSHPFTQQAASTTSPMASAMAASVLTHLLPTLLFRAWLGGFVVVLGVW